MPGTTTKLSTPFQNAVAVVRPAVHFIQIQEVHVELHSSVWLFYKLVPASNGGTNQSWISVCRDTSLLFTNPLCIPVWKCLPVLLPFFMTLSHCENDYPNPGNIYMYQYYMDRCKKYVKIKTFRSSSLHLHMLKVGLKYYAAVICIFTGAL